MKTLVIMNEKGGVGKTNLAAHAGWFFAERYRTLVIDLDQQANLTTTMEGHITTTRSVELFSTNSTVVSKDLLTVTRSTRELLQTEGDNRECIEIFRDNLKAMDAQFDMCVIDTPPALTNRTYAALLASDAVLAPIGINDYSISGITELLRAIKGVSAFYQRPEPMFLGLLPSIYDRKSRREREMFESLAEQAGKILFPGIVAKRDSYLKAASAQQPVWALKGTPAKEAGLEIRHVFDVVEQRMELSNEQA